jgi:hypothetical protein
MVIIPFIAIIGYICTIIFFELLAGVLIDNIKREYPEIKSIDIFSDLGRRTLDISFYNNKHIILENVNSCLKGNIRVKRIGEYGFIKYGRYSVSSVIDIGIIENELKVKFYNVNDIIKNYDLIYNYAVSLEKRDSEKYNKYAGGIWVWDENNLKRIKFNDRWYVLFSFSWESTHENSY